MAGTGKKKILVADDSRTALMFTTMALSREPYQLVTAGDGEDAVSKALADPPDLIVLDVVMPRCDGFEACRRLRGNEATRGIPIIMLTTRGEEPNVQAGFDSGCTEYITKPINVAEFLAKVRTLLGSGAENA